MGDDGTFWGGEVLVATLASYRRAGRFGRAPMPGGALAVKKPYRMALGYLLAAEAFEPAEAEPSSAVSSAGLPKSPVRSSTGSIRERSKSSGCSWLAGSTRPWLRRPGRLFDAAASLLGIRDVCEYEAQAAIELELLAEERSVEPLDYALFGHASPRFGTR